jgi:hypothetical protein
VHSSAWRNARCHICSDSSPGLEPATAKKPRMIGLTISSCTGPIFYSWRHFKFAFPADQMSFGKAILKIFDECIRIVAKGNCTNPTADDGIPPIRGAGILSFLIVDNKFIFPSSMLRNLKTAFRPGNSGSCFQIRDRGRSRSKGGSHGGRGGLFLRSLI